MALRPKSDEYVIFENKTGKSRQTHFFILKAVWGNENSRYLPN